MNLQEAYELRRQEVLSLQRQNKKLQKELEQVAAGLFTPEEKISLHKQIIKLARTLADTEKERDRYRNLWDRERERNLTCEFARMDAEEENRLLKEENRSLKEQLSAFRKEAEQDAAKKIQALCDEVSRLQAILDNDGTNSGTPTSKSPAGKKKVIPNSRVKSHRKPGGQPGHAKAALPMLAEEEVTEYEDHTMDACPACGSLLRKVSERAKDEIDYEVKVVKRRHRFIEYICTGCGKLVHSPIPSALKEPAQYGKNLQATALSLLNLGFVSISRSARFLAGLLHGTSPCEGFLAKLQERYAKQLQGFVADARQYCLNIPLLFWDDTVIFINATRGCLRFYGNERVALYKAHTKKDRAGLDEDNILALLGPGTVVMHDHNTVNYNADFRFTNAECNQHLERDLQKLADITRHEWPVQLKELIQSFLHTRKAILLENKFSFSNEAIQDFFRKLNEIMKLAAEEFAKNDCRYAEGEERRLLTRIKKYRDNYFNWVKDFRIPTSNNLSERSLRMVKCREKVSGQFHSVETARHFADIRTYLETCRRNGINEFDALTRLTQGIPFTIEELLTTGV